MSVHSLPNPGGVAVPETQRTARGRWKMALVMLVCAAPVVASYFTYYVVRPESRRSYGELIDPQRPLPAVNAATLDGKSVPLPALQGQWLLVSVAGGACAAPCENHLYLQRQLREALGKEKERLDWVWLVDDQAPVPDALKTAVAQATVLRVDGAVLRQWLQPEPGHTLAEHLYVVDPMGHWMMRFPANIDRSGAARAKRDIDRLMRASAGWDKAGR